MFFKCRELLTKVQYFYTFVEPSLRCPTVNLTA